MDFSALNRYLFLKLPEGGLFKVFNFFIMKSHSFIRFYGLTTARAHLHHPL
jgi:hypothetical protein